MSATLPVPVSSSCCPPSAPVVNIPGATGAASAAGTDGADGTSAFTLLTSDFTMPAELASATAVMENTDWLAPGAIVVINGSYFEVDGEPADSTHALLKNLADTPSSAYLGNAAPTTVFGSGTKVTPAGPQGVSGALTGAAGGDLAGNYPNPTLGITATTGDLIVRGASANQRLGVGTDGTRPIADSSKTLGLDYRKVNLAVATEVTGIAAIANGGTGQATKAPAFDALSPNTTRGDLTVRGAAVNARLALGAANTVLKSDGTDAGYSKVTSAMMDATAKYQGRYGILGFLAGVNLNALNTDNAIAINSTRYIVRRIIIENISAAITTATAGVFTNTGAAGTVVAATQALDTAVLDGVTKFDDMTLASPGGTATVHTASNLYFRTVTPEGSARTCTVWIEGHDLSA